MDLGGTAACALNAANEVTVQAFLDGKIGFLDIARMNEEAMKSVDFVSNPSYEDYVHVDQLARQYLISKYEL